MPEPLTRRRFAALIAAAALPDLVLGCGTATAPPLSQGSGRLQSRPGTPTLTIAAGLHPLGLGGARDGSLLVPAKYSPSTPAPLVLALHGANGAAVSQLNLLTPYAEDRGFLVLAVDSRDVTWDGVLQQFGPDVAFIDSALQWAFARCAVDPSHVIVEGFSDGATYAISLALANGDLFRRAMVCSPGSIRESNSGRTGKSEFFVSHGRQDTVLPVARSRDDIVPTLRQDGYTVEYLEFDGGHELPPAVAAAGVDWILRA